MIGIVHGDTQTATNTLDNISRASFVTLFQFKVETLFKNLLVNLGLTDPPQGYYNIIQELLSRVSINEKARIQQILEVPALIRNSLHSNGVHYGYRASSTHIEVDGLMFDFVHRDQVRCAGWKHLIHAMTGTLSVIEEVLGAPEIEALPDPIEDLNVGDSPG